MLVTSHDLTIFSLKKLSQKRFPIVTEAKELVTIREMFPLDSISPNLTILKGENNFLTPVTLTLL